MKREIKFRAWDTHQKKMSYDTNVYSYSKDEWDWNADHINPDNGDTICSFDSGYLMQFTGLCDRSKKEIYEGDIVLVANVDHYVTCQIINDVGWLFDIQDGAGGSWNRRWRYADEEIEVIGNIYENIELLK